MTYVALYLAAIVAANLAVARFGPSASVLIAFVFVAFDFVTRDALHDLWRGRRLWPRMLALIAAGGAISYLVNRDAGQIAVASTVAFVLASLADAAVYAAVNSRPFLARSSASNVAGAAVDSLVFPTLAFGALLPVIVLGQFMAKVLGGIVWGVILLRLHRVE